MPDDSTTLPQRRITLGKTLKFIVWLLPLVASVGVAVFFYLQWQKAQEQVEQVATTESTPAASREEIADIVEELSKIVLLPEGETPTLSTMTDTDALTENEDFFRGAQNGDKILVYQQAKKAFLYRPSIQKLINLAPVDIAGTDQPQPTTTGVDEKTESSPTPEPSGEAESFTVILLNGTSKQGLTLDFEPELLGAFKQTKVISRDNATRDDYEESVVVAVNLTKKAMAQQVADALGLTFAELPAGESKGEADMLIILGSDQL